jgi:hypothetical protein
MTAKETWKPVTIGGLTGILMGAGAMYGVQAIASGSNEVASGAEDGLKVATVDDSMSFSQAFEAARAQVGAGGVFTWRGNIFNTYTADEWKAMSDGDKHQFAEQVKPEVPASEVDTKQVADVEPQTEDDDVQIAQDIVQPQDHDVEVKPESTERTNAQVTSWNDLAESDDVRIVGFKDIDMGRGRSIAMQELEINGQRVAVIDVDKDGEPDLAMTDLNHNQQMDEGEVIDLHTGEALSFANDDPATDNVPDFDTFNA